MSCHFWSIESVFAELKVSVSSKNKNDTDPKFN